MDAELEAKGLRTVGQVLADLAINPHSQTIYQALKEYQEWLAERPAHVQVAERTATGPSPLDWEALRRATPAGMVAEWLAILDERKRTVIRQRFGFDGPVWTLIEIGRRLDVSRERARQVESQALRQLKRYYQLQIQTHRRHALTAIASLLHHQLVTARGGYLRLDAFVGWLNAEGQISLDGVNPEALIRLLCTVDDRFKFFPRHGAIALAGELPASLPSPIVGGKTGQRAPASPPSTRHRRGESQADLLARALESFGCPAHVADIARRAAELPSTARAPKQGTALQLLLQSDALISLGEGVFSLVAWERARAAEPRPVLPVCPRPWADVGLFHDQFFESVFAGREYLASEPTAIAFVADMLGWWGVDTAVRPWVRQSVLAAYYLVGLSPYAFPDEDDPPLRVDLPLLSIADTRRHCLRTLTARLVAMPGFWGLLRARGPARPKDLAEPMAARHPLGLVDVEARLHLLAGLGAVERLSTGLYRLTPLGEACAAEWGQVEVTPEGPRPHAGQPSAPARPVPRTAVVQLSECPVLWPDKVNDARAFLDFATQANHILAQKPTGEEFLVELLGWAGRKPNKSRRYYQNVLDACYVVGLIDRTSYEERKDRPLRSPGSPWNDETALRGHCIRAALARLEYAPRLLREVARHESFTRQQARTLLALTGENLDSHLQLFVNLGLLTHHGLAYRPTALVAAFAADDERAGANAPRPQAPQAGQEAQQPPDRGVMARSHEVKIKACPALLPDRVGESDTFMDSIIHANEFLAGRRTTDEFLKEMIGWAGRAYPKSVKYYQNILDAYYVVGLIGHVSYARNKDAILQSRMPLTSDVQLIRDICVRSALERLEHGCLLLEKARQLQPFTTLDIKNELNTHIHDASYHIRLFVSLGLFLREGVHYRLSSLAANYQDNIHNLYEIKTIPDRALNEPEQPYDVVDGLEALAYLSFD